MNKIISGILEKQEVEDVNGNVIKLNYNIPAEEGNFIQEVIKEIDAMKTLEIGTAYGISSLFICDAIQKKIGAHHITIDPYQKKVFKNIGIENLKKAGFENFTEFYEEFSHFILPQLLKQNIKIDFAFIDGYHLYDYALLDFFYIDKLLKIGGVVIIDDTIWPALTKLSQFIVTNRAYKLFKIEKRFVGNLTWKHEIFYTLMKKLKKSDLIKEGMRNFQEYKVALELPSNRFLAFIKEKNDEDYRDETFYKYF